MSIEDYRIAKKRGDAEYRKAISRGVYPYLPALDDIIWENTTAGEIPLGTFEIPISMIAGTKTRGRQNSFSPGFMPLLEADSEFASKWNSLLESQVRDGLRDPIKVYEYMNSFYVLEGNKRVSVMKYLGNPKIRATVTRILPIRTDDAERQAYFEFLDFYNVTEYYGITFTEQGCYKKLAQIYGQDLEHPWPASKVKALDSAYTFFAGQYIGHGGDSLRMTVGDAFLVYLSVYSPDSILESPVRLIQERVKKLWNEFLTENREDNVDLRDTPVVDTERPRNAFRRFLRVGSRYTDSNPLRVAWIHDRNPETSSWILNHENGRRDVERVFGDRLETMTYCDCGEPEQIARAIDDAVAKGAEVIFTTSPSLMPETFKSAIHYPDVKFLNCSVNMAHRAVRTYYMRTFEAKFVLGALAASVADDHRIGYQADYPIHGAVANINAFALGAAMVDPKCKVYLSWASVKGADWRGDLADKGLTVISGPDLVRDTELEPEYGVYLVDADGNPKRLASPLLLWSKYYELILRSIIYDTWDRLPANDEDQAINYWYGMSSGVVSIYLGDSLPRDSRKLVEFLKAGIIGGTVSPFGGVIQDQSGRIVQPYGGELSGKEIITMDWLNENIEGSFPEKWSLNQSAQKVVDVSGVI